MLRWVEALESGEYKQGVGSLRPTHDTYCCLGVATLLAEQDGVVPPDGLFRDPFKYTRCVIDYNSKHQHTLWCLEDSVLSGPVCHWLGITEHNPVLERDSAADLNDDGVPFAEIAAMLRARFLYSEDET